MELERRLSKVAAYHLALFVLPILSLLFYGWWSAAELDQRPDNPFRLSPMALRGDIVDRNGEPLAHSQDDRRIYPLKAAAGSLVGYHLRGRNQSGLEAILQEDISPPAPPKSLWGAMEMDRERHRDHPPLKGPDAVLTIDANLQKALYQAFSPRSGAVAVAEQETGEILAAVSAPSFDPNTIGGDFQELRNDSDSPLIERVGGGLYPVRGAGGGALLRLPPGHRWLAETPFPFYPGASAAVELDGQVLLSPLMLLQLAGQLGPNRGLEPRLIHQSLSIEGLKRPAPPPLPALAGWQTSGAFQLLVLPGPRFRQSPPFLVLLGRRSKGPQPLAFAAVVEKAGLGEAERLAAALLPLLEPR
jgi:hypothetical protein